MRTNKRTWPKRRAGLSSDNRRVDAEHEVDDGHHCSVASCNPLVAKPTIEKNDLGSGLTEDEARRLAEIRSQRVRISARIRFGWRLRNSGRRYRGCSSRGLLQLALGEYVDLGYRVAVGVQRGFGIFSGSEGTGNARSLEGPAGLDRRRRRDGTWQTLPATTLVPGDVVKLSLGSVVPGDVRLTKGAILIDQSMLTGRSVPIEKRDRRTYAGALVRRGEAVVKCRRRARVQGPRRNAELIRTAHVESTEQKAIFRVVRNLADL